jgi:hypothetical protein
VTLSLAALALATLELAAGELAAFLELQSAARLMILSLNSSLLFPRLILLPWI